jgi:hypothetical protein
MHRRAFLRLGLGGAAAGVLTACGADTPRPARPDPTRTPQLARSDRAGRILLASFSRPGENYWNGGRRNLQVGNTEVLAREISARLDCDVHRIEAADPYARDCRGARIATGLAVRGEQARSAGADVDAWLRRTGLLDGR